MRKTRASPVAYSNIYIYTRRLHKKNLRRRVSMACPLSGIYVPQRGTHRSKVNYTLRPAHTLKNSIPPRDAIRVKHCLAV
jgi:hypothetical protein